MSNTGTGPFLEAMNKSEKVEKATKRMFELFDDHKNKVEFNDAKWAEFIRLFFYLTKTP